MTTTTSRSTRPPASGSRNGGTVAVPHLSVAERVARGKAARAEVPRSSHAGFEPSRRSGRSGRAARDGRRRRGCRSWSRFATAGCWSRRSRSTEGRRRSWRTISRPTPRSGLNVQCCGDAHLSNFGVFASPERRLVFDINDFDETLPGPWEWDVKRLAVSMLIAARDNGYRAKDQERTVLDTVARYRTAMAEFAGDEGPRRLVLAHGNRERARRNSRRSSRQNMVKRAEKTLAKARTKDSMAAFSKLTQSSTARCGSSISRR